MRDKQLQAKYSKCEFFHSSLHCLENIVSKKGVLSGAKKVEVIAKLAKPYRYTYLYLFLGCFNYYDHLMDYCAHIYTLFSDPFGIEVA